MCIYTGNAQPGGVLTVSANDRVRNPTPVHQTVTKDVATWDALDAAEPSHLCEGSDADQPPRKGDGAATAHTGKPGGMRTLLLPSSLEVYWGTTETELQVNAENSFREERRGHRRSAHAAHVVAKVVVPTGVARKEGMRR